MSADNINLDRGWGLTVFSGADKPVLSRNIILKNKLVSAGLVCSLGGNVYVFIPTVNYWSVFCAP